MRTKLDKPGPAGRPSRRMRRLAIVPAIVLIATLVQPQRPTPAEWSDKTPAAGTLSVMTFNILYGGRPASDALDAIAAAKPGLMCIQELTPDLAARFEMRLGQAYPHRLFEPRETSGGIGIASRRPITDGAILGLGFKAVLGDMNEWRGQAAVSLLAEAGFANACDGQNARCGATWPGETSNWPAFIRIDHIFGRGGDFLDASTLEAGGSDHYPIVARFRVKGGAS